MQKWWKMVVAALFCLVLVGCGVKGNLYFPADNNANAEQEQVK